MFLVMAEAFSSVFTEFADVLTTIPTVAQYFEAFNQGDFEATAALFSAQGRLLPPFEAERVGREAIATYLSREASGMRVSPRKVKPVTCDGGLSQVEVIGKVQTAAFQINAKWQFQLDDQFEIQSLEIKLMATLKELLSLNS